MDNFLLFLLFALYLLPTVICVCRGHHNSMAIVVLNILLGWTFIGWVAALVWSCTAVWTQLKGPSVLEKWEGKYRPTTPPPHPPKD